MAVDEKLLKNLVCPWCKGAIKWNEKRQSIVCEHCRLLYEVKNDILIVLIDETNALRG